MSVDVADAFAVEPVTLDQCANLTVGGHDCLHDLVEFTKNESAIAEMSECNFSYDQWMRHDVPAIQQRKQSLLSRPDVVDPY